MPGREAPAAGATQATPFRPNSLMFADSRLEAGFATRFHTNWRIVDGSFALLVVWVSIYSFSSAMSRSSWPAVVAWLGALAFKASPLLLAVSARGQRYAHLRKWMLRVHRLVRAAQFIQAALDTHANCRATNAALIDVLAAPMLQALTLRPMLADHVRYSLLIAATGTAAVLLHGGACDRAAACAAAAADAGGRIAYEHSGAYALLTRVFDAVDVAHGVVVPPAVLHAARARLPGPPDACRGAVVMWVWVLGHALPTAALMLSEWHARLEYLERTAGQDAAARYDRWSPPGAAVLGSAGTVFLAVLVGWPLLTSRALPALAATAAAATAAGAAATPAAVFPC